MMEGMLAHSSASRMIYPIVPGTYHSFVLHGPTGLRDGVQRRLLSSGSPANKPLPSTSLRIGQLVSVPPIGVSLPMLKTLAFRNSSSIFHNKALFMELKSVSSYFGLSRDTENLICTLALYALLY